MTGVYIDGISLTHGAAGSRQHLLLHSMNVVVSMSTYVLAQTPTQTGDTKYRPSSETIISVTLAILHGPGYSTDIYQDDPLWDGEGCGPSSTC